MSTEHLPSTSPSTSPKSSRSISKIALEGADAPVFKLLFETRVVYGGYLRDTFAKVSPKDIDVVLPTMNFESFDKSMIAMGYIRTDDETYVYTKESTTPVEAISEKDDPDFNVNLLTYNGTKMYSWIDPEEDLRPIFDCIHNSQAISLEPSTKRKKKILSKGYTIVK